MPRRIPNAIAYKRSRRRVNGRPMQQSDLARLLRTDVPRVSYMEAGVMMPTATELRTLCRALRCKPEDIYTGRALALALEEA